MEIKSAEFVKSSIDLSQMPPETLPEYAFAGRSNVGKSSWINALCRRKSLAKTSGTPGKTQTANFFLINQAWHLVDLPGYGYAKVSHKQRAGFSDLIESYLLKREVLQCVFVLVDCRIPPQKSDLEFIEFLGEEGIPMVILYTKTDKLGPKAVDASVKAFEEALGEDWEELPPSIRTSAISGAGRDEVLKLIHETNQVFLQAKKMK